MEKVNPFVFSDSTGAVAQNFDAGRFYGAAMGGSPMGGRRPRVVIHDEVQWDYDWSVFDDHIRASLLETINNEFDWQANKPVDPNAAMIARDAPQATPKIVSQSQVEADIREKELAFLQELMRKYGVPAMPVPEKVKESTPVGLTMVANTTHRLGVNAWQNRD